MERHHSIKEQVRLPLGDHLDVSILSHESWQLAQVCAHEIPDTVFGTLLQFEPPLKTAIGLERRFELEKGTEDGVWDFVRTDTVFGTLLQFEPPLKTAIGLVGRDH